MPIVLLWIASSLAGFALIRDLRHRLDQIERILHHMAADLSSVKALVSAIDTETNAVAAKVDAQTAKIAALQATIDAGGTVTAADLQGLVDGLQPISDRLTAIGADPASPIPTAVG